MLPYGFSKILMYIVLCGVSYIYASFLCIVVVCVLVKQVSVIVTSIKFLNLESMQHLMTYFLDDCDYQCKMYTKYEIMWKSKKSQWSYEWCTLQWRHNGHDGVSNHHPCDCLLNHLFRRRSKKASKLRVTGLCEGNSGHRCIPRTKGPVMRKMFPFDDVIM